MKVQRLIKELFQIYVRTCSIQRMQLWILGKFQFKISEAMEINDMKYEDRIKEFENEQGDLIFECFQDEIS